MDEILFRLLRNLDDGSYEVVGYEKHEGGAIYHSKDMEQWGDIMQLTYIETLKEHALCPTDTYTKACHLNYIPHDRKDIYTGIEVDGVKLFEKDKVEVVYGDTTTHTIQYCGEADYPAFDLSPYLENCESNGIMHCMCHYDVRIKIIGIEGVK